MACGDEIELDSSVLLTASLSQNTISALGFVVGSTMIFPITGLVSGVHVVKIKHNVTNGTGVWSHRSLLVMMSP
jgi:hypothetical protein